MRPSSQRPHCSTFLKIKFTRASSKFVATRRASLSARSLRTVGFFIRQPFRNTLNRKQAGGTVILRIAIFYRPHRFPWLPVRVQKIDTQGKQFDVASPTLMAQRHLGSAVPPLRPRSSVLRPLPCQPGPKSESGAKLHRCRQGAEGGSTAGTSTGRSGLAVIAAAIPARPSRDGLLATHYILPGSAVAIVLHAKPWGPWLSQAWVISGAEPDPG